MSRIVDPCLLYGKDVRKKIMAYVRETIFLLLVQLKLVRLGSSTTPILIMLPILPAGQRRYSAVLGGYSYHIDAQCIQGSRKANQPWMDKWIIFHQRNQ